MKLSFGVQVYFVDEEKFREIKEASDRRLDVVPRIRGLKSENEIRGVNVKEFPS